MSDKTIEDVAHIVGCSVGTVSRAINNRKGVSEKTRQHILQTMKEIGYRPNALAQNLLRQRTHLIAVIIPDVSHNFFSKIVQAAEVELSSKQYNVLLFSSNWDSKVEREKIALAQSLRVDGIILNPSSDDLPVDELASVPTILVNHTAKGNISYVDIDNEESSFNAIEYLIRCGYKRIAFMGGDPVSYMVNLRQQGYERALEKYHIPFDENLVCHSKYTIEAGYNEMEKLFQLPNPPDAIYCHCDDSALGAYKCASDHGLSVPDDMGIVGFDNDEIAGLPQVELTTVDQLRYQIGKLAAQMIINMVENKEDWNPQKIILTPKLIVRKTTRPPVK
mgnify:FL=1